MRRKIARRRRSCVYCSSRNLVALCALLVGIHAPLSAQSQGRGAASNTAQDGVYKSFGMSPDARTLLYLRAAGAFPTFELYLRDAETGATARVTNEAVHHAAWSPDGKTVAYQWLDLDGRFHVCLYDVATRESTELAAGRLKSDFLEWSPDSAELLYLSVEPHGQDAFETGEWDSTLRRHPLRGGPVTSIPGVQWARFSEGQLVVAGNPAPAGYRSIPNPNAERIERFAIHAGQIYANTRRDGASGESRWNAVAGVYEPVGASRLATGGPLTAPAGGNWRLPYFGLAGMVQGGAGYSGGACDGAVCMAIAHNGRLNYALDFQQVSEANEGNQHILAVEAGTVAALSNNLACSTMMACTVNYDGYSKTCKDPNTGAGNYVVIAHLDGSYSMYAHLKSGSVAVQVGQTVAQGAYLADQGHSGGAAAYNNYRTCGDHLHYQRQTAPAVWSQAIPTDFEDTPCLLACTNIYPSKNVELAPAPAVAAIQPVSALAGSTVNVTFTGSDYLYGTTLTVNGPGVTAGTVSVVSATQATATLVVAPDAALGPRDLVLTTARGSSQPLPFQVSVPVAVTLATQPVGLTLTVDGQSCISPCALQWHSGTTHILAAPVVVMGVPGVTGTRLAWKSWSDGGTASHSVTAPLTAVTYTATFATQHLLTTVAAPAAMGSIAPATGWFDSGAIVPVSATPAAGFAFTGFSGVLTGIVTPQPITMAGPASVTAGFRSLYSLSPVALNFAAPVGATALTAPQVITVNGSGGINTWTATSDKPWLQVTPIAGQRNGRFTISILRSALPPLGIYTGKVTITAGAAYAGSLVLPCTLSMKPFTGAPFGTLETPADGATGLAGSVAVTGWALDDIGVNKVTIWRDRVGAEGVHPNGLVYIGDATFVAGARPDVEASQPGLPAAYRAGWGYLLLTNALPGPPAKGGNGVFKFHAFAVDEEGNQTRLGTKSFTVDNQSSVRPFGSIDSPAPGETVSGASFSNSGWALTPQPSLIPADGSTIWVNIDGVNVAHPQYGGARSDVASIFPAFGNSLASAGVYALDTTKYANGTHTIAWIVFDNLNHGDGIGSRFFEIQNAPPAATGSAAAAPVPAPLARAARSRRAVAADAANPAFRTGYNPSAALAPIRMAEDGLYDAVALPEMGLLEIQLPAGAGWQAALRFGDQRRELPIGSTFDADSGIFYWQAGPGFLGRFELEFLSAGVPPLVIPVEITTRR